MHGKRTGLAWERKPAPLHGSQQGTEGPPPFLMRYEVKGQTLFQGGLSPDAWGRLLRSD